VEFSTSRNPATLMNYSEFCVINKLIKTDIYVKETEDQKLSLHVITYQNDQLSLTVHKNFSPYYHFNDIHTFVDCKNRNFIAGDAPEIFFKTKYKTTIIK